MKNLYHYFKWNISNFPLPSPNGPSSREVPAIAINEASKDIKKVIEDSEDEDSVELNREYAPKDKATISNYVVMHGMNAALRHFKKFPDLKYMTVYEWRKAIIVTNHKMVTELEEKREKGQQCSIKSYFLYYEVYLCHTQCWWHNQHSHCDSCSFRYHKEGKSYIVGM